MKSADRRIVLCHVQPAARRSASVIPAIAASAVPRHEARLSAGSPVSRGECQRRFERRTVTEIGEQVGRAQRRVRVPAAVSDRSSITKGEPVLRIVVNQPEACASVGGSEDVLVERMHSATSGGAITRQTVVMRVSRPARGRSLAAQLVQPADRIGVGGRSEPISRQHRLAVPSCDARGFRYA